MASTKAIVLLPVRDNDGRSLAVEIALARDGFYAAFGGWTLQGTVTGAFRMPDGTASRDVCESYMVFFDEDRLEEFLELVRMFKAATSQQAICVEIQHHVDIRLI